MSRRIIIAFLLGGIITVTGCGDGKKRKNTETIPYRTLKCLGDKNYQQMRHRVEVSLVNGRLPNEAELRAVAKAVFPDDNAYRKYAVEFYLPGMSVNGQFFASCDYNTFTKENFDSVYFIPSAFNENPPGAMLAPASMPSHD